MSIRLRAAALAALGMLLTGCAQVADATPTPTLPAGDPGPEAPSMPDPAAPAAEHEHGEPRRVVPPDALVDVATLGEVVGGRWRVVEAAADTCLVDERAVATRTMSYASADQRLVETLSTYDTAEAADRAVRSAERRLAGCGWAPAGDPRIGSAALAATHEGSGDALVVVSADGVTVTLVGAKEVAADRWAALADLALGSSCPAAPDGCH
ncbi:MAG: hypothetical protein ACRDO1_05295 [Nocardioidaceae bacterium]